MTRQLHVSIIIPTYQRRDVVVRIVEALERQFSRDFEVIVVVDGSTDGTSAALRRRRMSFPVTVLEQANSGSAAARNAGAAAAKGGLLLFLDDDMEAHPRLIAEHLRSHEQGADIVLGHVPLHPDSPATILSRGVATWAEGRRARLAALGPELPGTELLTGQMSITKAAFESLGRFDVTFTRGGLFGGEDRDFGYRAVAAGLRLVFNQDAVSYQYYAVDPAAYTRRSREAGRAAVELKAKHPELTRDLSAGRVFRTRRSRAAFGLLGVAHPAISRPLCALAEHRVRTGRLDRRTEKLFFALQTMEYKRGSRRAKRTLAARDAIVLAYHAISDLRGDPVLADYGVPAPRFAQHLDMLARIGRRFISLEMLLSALDGEEELPAGSVLVTFDDAYTDLLTAACPVLADRGIPAVVFVVAGRIGGTNDWDHARGAKRLTLLDEDGVRAVAGRGLAIGSHGMTHRPLVDLEQAEVAEELEGSAVRLTSLGLPRPVAFAYPHGLWTPNIAVAVRDAGYRVGFTIRPGVVRRTGRHALPRIEVRASDSPRTLRLKVLTAHWPDPLRRRLLRLLGVRG